MQNAMQSESMFVGDIDERGFLNNLFRKGFTRAKSLSEGHGNSIDAGSENISYHVLREKIKEVDDGCGMDKIGLKNAFSTDRSNHSGDHSIGVSGIGLKALLNILGNKKPTKTITKTENGPYLTAEAPWDVIHADGRYTNMIIIRESTEEEIADFNQDRAHAAVIRGTTHIFNYSSDLASAIAQQFETPDSCHTFVPEDQFAVVYGRFKQNVTFHHFEMTQPKTLQYYNYFDAEETEFYGGIQKERIVFMENAYGDKRYVWRATDSVDYEIPRKGRGFGSEVERVTTNLSSWKPYGELTVIAGARRDPEYFNDDHPVMPGSGIIMHPYDKAHVGEDNFEFLAKIPVIRNGQLIGVTELPGLKISSARGQGETMNKLYNTHCEVRYEPISTNDNKQDLDIGVQECKTQFICAMPQNLLRLIKCIKFEKAKKVWHYFEVKCASRAPEPSPVPEPEPPLLPDPIPEPPLDPVPAPELPLAPEPPIAPEPPLIPEPVQESDSSESSETDSSSDSDTDSEPEPEPEPVNVRGHRRGMVLGSELQAELQRILSQINATDRYSSAEMVQLYNILCKM